MKFSSLNRKKNCFLLWGCLEPKTASQGGCAVSISGDMQNLTEHPTEKFGLDDCALNRGFGLYNAKRWHQTLFMWFCESTLSTPVYDILTGLIKIFFFHYILKEILAHLEIWNTFFFFHFINMVIILNPYTFNVSLQRYWFTSNWNFKKK